MLNEISKDVYLRCDDHAECVVFSRHDWERTDISYEFTIEDSYCGGDYMGIKGRFKRAWKAFWAKPVYYSGVYCQDGARMRKFLEDCLNLMNEDVCSKPVKKNKSVVDIFIGQDDADDWSDD